MLERFTGFARSLCLIGLIAIPGAVSAEGTSIGISLGESELDEFCDGAGGISCDDTDTGMKIFAGHDINPNFRAEAFWVDLGEVEASNSAGDFVESEADGIGLAAMPMFPASDRVDIFGKFGVLMWDAEATTNVFGPTETASDDGSDTFFGFGFRARINDQFSLRAEWEEFELDDSDVSLLTIGGEVRF